MASQELGATLLMRVPRAKVTPALIRKAIDVILAAPHPSPGQVRMWGENPAWAKDKVDRVLQGGFFPTMASWEPLAAGQAIGMTTTAQYCLDAGLAKAKLALDDEANLWLAVWLYAGNFKATESEKVDRVVGVFKDMVRAVRPSFAAVDNFAENMAKRKAKDPRRFAWGAMCYDAEHVKAIGVDRLAGCAAIIKETWPDGSMWIQTWANPFIVAKELTQEMERELGLKQLFADAESKPLQKARGR